MCNASITIFVCLLSHVRRICGCLPPPICKSAPRSHQYRLPDRFICRQKKNNSTYPLDFSCVPRGKQKLLILGEMKWEIIERWHTPFKRHLEMTGSMVTISTAYYDTRSDANFPLCLTQVSVIYTALDSNCCGCHGSKTCVPT